MSEIYDFKKTEKTIKEYWTKHNIPQKITNFNKNTKKKFYLLDGPPYANGSPHAGHVMTIVFKDIWGKFKTMQGYDVWYQPGFDCHGLPIENKVEKLLDVKSKQDIIEKIGEDKFIDECRKFSIQALDEWMDFYKQIGAWKGWLEPYLTFKDYYIESGWWTIKTLYEKGLMVEGKKPIHWCPKCESPLSGYEVTDSYKDVSDPSVYLKFSVEGKNKEYLLVWTTTPWTLPSNVALLVHPDEIYVKAKVEDETYILAEKRLKEVFEKKKIKDYKIIKKLKGTEIAGLKYRPLLDVPVQKTIDNDSNAHKVYLSIPILKKVVGAKLKLRKDIKETPEEDNFGHLVTMDTGTGIVHMAPGHGAEDNKIGKHYNLPEASPLDDKCHFTKEAGFSGFVKDADKDIIEHLIGKNKMFFKETLVHSYPLCWRCKSPLIFRLSKQWFFPIETFHKRMMAETQNTKFMPPFAKSRMQNWLAESGDWCISIQRFWGIPIPMWKCKKCQTIEVIASKKELQNKMKNNIKLGDDLHKNVVDKVILKCPECDSDMRRIPDLVNIWVESGISPWASLGYPNSDNGLFEALKWADVVDESQDQIRGWFYAMMFMGNAVFGKSPFKACAVNGWTLDEKGEKMSKSIGNVVSAQDCIDELGIDILRFYNCYNIAPWETHKFNVPEAKKTIKMMNILDNICSYINMYKVNTDISGKKQDISKFSKENRWMLSLTNTLIEEVTGNIENFNFHIAGRKMSDFIVESFSRKYIKLIRDSPQNKNQNDYVVSTVLYNFIKLLAPFCPAVTEDIYLKVFKKQEGKDSVHMCSYPITDNRIIDKNLEKEMDIIWEMATLSNSIRNEHNIKLRWPIAKITVSTNQKFAIDTIKNNMDLIKKQTNAVKIEFGNVDAVVVVKPNFAKLGQVFGNKTKEIAKLITSQDPKKLKEQWQAGTIKIKDTILEKDMIIVEEKVKEGLAGRMFFGGSLYVDTKFDNELIEEAFINDLMREIQILRKEAKLKLNDKINLCIECDKQNLIDKWSNIILKKTNSIIVKEKSKTKYKKSKTFEFEFKDSFKANAKIYI
ncbi:MAG: isoleucine--tRNA ligase [Candidatus Aenigmarchaeota archaeon]|nr:isoleucine--tRNA ligase [Candidatus Aenigmarchaeota archaeon]